jgi:hypothetical protein
VVQVLSVPQLTSLPEAITTFSCLRELYIKVSLALSFMCKFSEWDEIRYCADMCGLMLGAG